MSQNLNKVGLAGLVRRNGQVALHLHFERPHDGPSLGVFFREFGDFTLARPEDPMQPVIESDRSVITLVPLQPTEDLQLFTDASSHLGYDGPLHFIDSDDCEPIDEVSRWTH